MAKQDQQDQLVAARDAAVAHLGAKDIGWQALGPAISCAILSTLIVGLRWYTRCRLVRCLGCDDYVILLSLILAWAMTALIAAAVQAGVGLYDGSVQTSLIIKLIVANNNIWALTVNVTKASILMQYFRVFAGLKTRLACFSLLFGLLPAALWAVLGGTLLCSPVEKLWRPEIEGKCISAKTYWISVASIDISLDFLVLLLPLPAITSLRLPKKQKLSLTVVFALGFFVCAVSIARLLTVYLVSQTHDHVGSVIWSIILSAVEANVGIICACLLALKPLVEELCPKLVEGKDGMPSHCMRIAHIPSITGGQDADGILAWPGEEATLIPDSPTRSRGSKSDVASKRFSIVRTPLSQDASRRTLTRGSAQTESYQLQQPPLPRCSSRGQSGRSKEVVDILDILRSPEDRK